MKCVCGREKPAPRFRTDGNGKAVEVTPECKCKARKRAGICRYCPNPIAGDPKRCSICAECRKHKQARAMRRWRVNREEQYRAALRRTRKSRTASKRRWEKLNPDKLKAQRRRLQIRRTDDPARLERTKEYRRNYRAKNYDRIREGERRRYEANREQRLQYKREYYAARRAWYREYDRLHKRVYPPGTHPVCKDCGAPVPWLGRGQPKRRCQGGCKQAAAA